MYWPGATYVRLVCRCAKARLGREVRCGDHEAVPCIPSAPLHGSSSYWDIAACIALGLDEHRSTDEPMAFLRGW